MRTAFDFAPLCRSGIGFESVRRLLGEISRIDGAAPYPSYNIEKTGDDTYRVTLAVAGFAPDELAITAEPNRLTVSGRKAEDGAERRFLYRGIAARAFERQFALVDYVKVSGARLDHGLLRIDLVREVPEAMKPKRIPIIPGKNAQAIERRTAAGTADIGFARLQPCNGSARSPSAAGAAVAQ